jgi:hypothetical protein
VSLKHVCSGSAMGRITFYNIQEEADYIISDVQPELIRGVSIQIFLSSFKISHSANGDSIYVSIGDISCQRFCTDAMVAPDHW